MMDGGSSTNSLRLCIFVMIASGSLEKNNFNFHLVLYITLLFDLLVKMLARAFIVQPHGLHTAFDSPNFVLNCRKKKPWPA